MCTHNPCFELKKEKNMKKNHLKIIILHLLKSVACCMSVFSLSNGCYAEIKHFAFFVSGRLSIDQSLRTRVGPMVL